ncbi:MAG: radical SAM protein [Synergistaceae bacterium]|nr:radical SAM protein [Synergistaceae bacterium]
MYYKLNEKYILRGWENLPYALIDTRTGLTSYLSARQFQAMKYCNGKVDLSMPFIDSETQSTIKQAHQAGIIEPCEPGEKLMPNQEYKKFPSRYLNRVHWSITGKCNYRCRHCYMSAPDASSQELSHDDIMKIINELAACGVMNVSLTGGEPLIRDDFLDIVDELLSRNINITQIYSNGCLVNEKLLRELDDRKIHPEFNMSFDGVGFHDWLRGIPGAEKAVDRAFRLCRDMGFPTGSEMAIHNDNKHVLRESINYLASVGVRSLKTSPVSNVGEWKKNFNTQSITKPELFQIYLDYLPYYYSDGMPLTILLGSFFTASPSEPDKYFISGYRESYDHDKTYSCTHVLSSIYITPEGRALMCIPISEIKMQENFPFIIDKGLSECLKYSEYLSFINLKVNDILRHNDECRNCKFIKHCSTGCRGVALLNDENNLMGKSPDLCELFHGGWIRKIINTVKQARPSAKGPVIDDEMHF